MDDMCLKLSIGQTDWSEQCQIFSMHKCVQNNKKKICWGSHAPVFLGVRDKWRGAVQSLGGAGHLINDASPCSLHYSLFTHTDS